MTINSPGGGNGDARANRPSETNRVDQLVDHFFRHSWGETVARLSARYGLRHLESIEDAVQDALAAALRSWPLKGVPDNPGGWIFTAARNRLIDQLRHQKLSEAGEPVALAVRAVDAGRPQEAAFRGEVADEPLAMVFACCHPSISADARVALTLRLVGGLSTREIAAAFMIDEATVAQRIHRARQRLAQAGSPLVIPTGEALTERLDSVLWSIYLLFNEGYSAHGHENLVRFELCAEALRLVRLLAGHDYTALPPVRALAALICLQSARLPARTDTHNELVLLADQDRGRWDKALITGGLDHLKRSESGNIISRYHLEAGVAASHAVAPSYAATDWVAIRYYYDQLCALYPSPVYALNRAVAISFLADAGTALTELDNPDVQTPLAEYYLYHAAKADLLRQLDRRVEAVGSYRRAAELAGSPTERRFLERRLTEVESSIRA